MTRSPNTISSEITCSVSTIGKSHSPPSCPLIAMASGVCSRADRESDRVIWEARGESDVEFPGIADESAAEDDPDPQTQGSQREPLCAHRAGGRIPLRRIPAHLPREPDRERQHTQDHEHLQPERG